MLLVLSILWRSDMSLYEKINDDLIAAMKGGEKDKVGIFRMLLSEIKRIAIDSNNRDDINDDLVLTALTRALKSRKESVRQYREADREDLAEKEEIEIELVSLYLPEAISEEEISVIIDESIAEIGAQSKQDMGKVMRVVMPKLKGRADGKAVQKMVMACLD